MQCGICGNGESLATFRVKEMMHGYRDEFTYFQCPRCKCLQIADFPENIGKYYPNEYYSFGSSTPVCNWYLTMLGSAIAYPLFIQAQADPRQKSALTRKVVDYYLSKTSITPESRILDVGCGDGSFLCALREIGFTNLSGVDLYIPQSMTHENGVSVLKGTIHDIESEWDLIMFHHSFEHILDQFETLEAARQRLSPGGLCLVRMPTVSSFAWEHYGVDWVSLDAPRHTFIHSVESFCLLLEESGLRLANVLYDSISFQFWGSEQYARDITLYSDRSCLVDFTRSIFSPAEMASFERRAQQVNRERRGDQAAFYLTRG